MNNSLQIQNEIKKNIQKISRLVNNCKFMPDDFCEEQIIKFNTLLFKFNGLKKKYKKVLLLYEDNKNSKSIKIIKNFINIINNCIIANLNDFKKIIVDCTSLIQNYEELYKVHEKIITYLEEPFN